MAKIASILLAAGKGSRMTGHSGNKTLLPLIPTADPFRGQRPILLEVLSNLPEGPRGIVVHHCAEQVRAATAHLNVTLIDQPTTNGTGGALLAAKEFIQQLNTEQVVITMGDVPLVRASTYRALLERLRGKDLVVLAFEPDDKAQYGVLELAGDQVERITEWKYWREYSPQRQHGLRYCNAGIYAARRPLLLAFLETLQDNPHRVEKQRDGKWVTIDEYFLTDLVELMSAAGHRVGMQLAPASEVTGVDTPEALRMVQARYARSRSKHNA